MSERGAQRSGINRAFSWLKRACEITEPTDAPDRLSPLVQPAIDLFGWERLSKQVGVIEVGGDAANIAVSVPVPRGVFRLILAASIQTDDPLQIANYWIEHRVSLEGDVGISLMRPFTMGAGTQGVRVGMTGWRMMAEGDRIVGRSFPAPAVGSALELRFSFVDLSEGEYVAATG